MDLAPLPEALAEMGEPQGTLGEIQESAGDGYSSTPAEKITDMDYLANYNTCFGAASQVPLTHVHGSLTRWQVMVHATLDTFASETDGDLSLAVRASGDIINLYREADKLVGLFISDGLSSLLGQFSVHMTATLAPSSTQGQIRVVIYGLFKDRDLIGKHLSKANLYLQHPTMEEYDQSVKYFNPHLLLRPGAKMPRIEDLSLQDDEPMSPGPTVLDEVRQGKIWRIFDSASGGEVVPKVTASPRLKTTLEKHQLTALEMMIERERGVIKGAKFPTLWELPNGAMNPRYRNKVTGWFDQNPAGLRGGILADEMGLGKTLSTLALICSCLDARDEVANECSTTLVIVPKSTLIGWETQIEKHILKGRIKYTTYHGPSRHDQARVLQGYDIVLTTYEVLRQDFAGKHERDTIYSHTWHRVVLDEAHRTRSRSTQLHEAAIAISKLSQTRWCLTGTPIHNSLDDYAALLSFLQVRGLNQKKTFDKFVAKPIKENQPCGMERLQALVRATSLRRTVHLNGASLGLEPRVEKVKMVELSASDADLYSFFQERSFRIAKGTGKGKEKGKGKGKGKKAKGAGVEKGDGNILSLILFLRLICNYGERILPIRALEAWQTRNSEAVNWSMMQQQRKSCSRLLVASENGDEEERVLYECAACQQDSDSAPRLPCSSSSRSAKVEALIRNLRTEQEQRADSSISKR
ncbi:hypothetical protein CEP54_010011 [Fusarium duplospermum]|uniref:Helicase ATP-binding domain-containing protein n=1 Tax=Fusarium duplospermum TaxID=1325734 RepID=A0A428PMM1_9HYPO|nr:hypothetical protein CEP54_010011 [Fusarium duplospermum]